MGIYLVSQKKKLGDQISKQRQQAGIEQGPLCIILYYSIFFDNFRGISLKQN